MHNGKHNRQKNSESKRGDTRYHNLYGPYVRISDAFNLSNNRLQPVNVVVGIKSFCECFKVPDSILLRFSLNSPKYYPWQENI